MNAEIGIKIKKIVIDNPYLDMKEGVTNDLTIISESGECVHIVGDNNVVLLINNALTKYYEKTIRKGVKL